MRANEKTAVVKLKEILEKKFAVIDFCVYGSKARGDVSEDSDVDVMIEIEESSPKIESEIDDVVYEVNLDNDCLISTVIFGRKELEEGPCGESPLYRMIRKEGLRI